MLPARETVHIEDAAGRTVGTFAQTAELRAPVRAEPGRQLDATFTWDQRECTGSCVQVPAGTYTAVVTWSSPATFSIGP